MDDVVALCPRVTVIDRGRIVHDGDLRQLVKSMHPDKRVSFTLPTRMPEAELSRLGPVIALEGMRATVRVGERELAAVVGHLLGSLRAVDLAIEDPPLEDVMRDMFGRARETAAK